MQISIILIPVLIFCARILDVSIGTIRIIFIARGMRKLSAVLGFFEVLIWLVAIVQIMNNLNSPIHYIAYAGGFAMGNFVGISIEDRLSMGNVMIRVVTRKDSAELVKFFNQHKYGITVVDAEGSTGPVKIIFTVVRRKNIQKVVGIIKQFNPNAFYTIEDIRFVKEENTYPINISKGPLYRFNELFFKKR